MANTPRAAIPKITGSQANDFAAHIDAVADAADSAFSVYKQGLFADRGAAGIGGRFYWSTDRKQLDYDDGTRWYTVYSQYWQAWPPLPSGPAWGLGIGAEPGADYVVWVDSTDHAEYQIVGDKLYFEYAALWRFTGPTNPSGAYGVVMNLPASAKYSQGVFSADVENGVGRCLLRNQDQLVVYPQGPTNPNRWTVDNFGRWVRLSGWYRLLVP